MIETCVMKDESKIVRAKGMGWGEVRVVSCEHRPYELMSCHIGFRG